VIFDIKKSSQVVRRSKRNKMGQSMGKLEFICRHSRGLGIPQGTLALSGICSLVILHTNITLSRILIEILLISCHKTIQVLQNEVL
jgi:hypothetical protein